MRPTSSSGAPKAQIAREAGLEPLMEALLKNPSLQPTRGSREIRLGREGIADAKAALDGARHILIERIGEEAALVGNLREWEWAEGQISSKVKKAKETEGAKFSGLFRLRSVHQRYAVASRAAAAARPERGAFSTSISTCRTTTPSRIRPRGAPAMLFGIADKGRPADRMARRDRAASPGRARTRDNAFRGSADAPQGARRWRGHHRGVLAEPARIFLLAAPAGPRGDHGPRSRHPHGRQGGDRRSDRQAWSRRRRSIRTSRGRDWQGSLGDASRRWP